MQTQESRVLKILYHREYYPQPKFSTKETYPAKEYLSPLVLQPVMPETYPIILEGKVLEWTTSIKHVGNYIRNDLSESDEIRHKQDDFIGRFNGLLARYHDPTHEVLMQLTSSYCTYLYWSQAWQFNDTNVHRMVTIWNKAIRRIWNLPTHSHRTCFCVG